MLSANKHKKGKNGVKGCGAEHLTVNDGKIKK